MDVRLVQAQASDASVVWAARISTGKGASNRHEGAELPDADKGLIGYLMRNRHGTPFEHSMMTFRVHAPVFVMREMQRHRTLSFNEESGRYRELEPVFWVPSAERKLVQAGKPGAYTFGEGTGTQHIRVHLRLRRAYEEAWDCYQDMLENGIAREVARACLPVGIYSSQYVTCNARSLMSFLSLRTEYPLAAYPSHPQAEIREVAEKMHAKWAQLMPVTSQAFQDAGFMAP